MFYLERIDTTLDLLLDSDLDTEPARLRGRLEDELRHRDQRLAKYRVLLDDGVDATLVAGWLKEVTATRQMTERRLTLLIAESHRTAVDRDVLRDVLTEIGGLVGLLADGDQADRARFDLRRSESPGPTNPRSTGSPSSHTLLGIWFVSEGGLEPTFTGPLRTAGSGRNGS